MKYASGKFKFGQGQTPAKNSRWAREILLIDKCPAVISKKTLFGNPVTCTCGYHDLLSSVAPPLPSTAAKCPPTTNPAKNPAFIEHLASLPPPIEKFATNNQAPETPETENYSQSTRQVMVRELIVSTFLNIALFLFLFLIFRKLHLKALIAAITITLIVSLLVGYRHWTKLISSGSANISHLKLWSYPPPVPGPDFKARPVAEDYFCRRFFLWMPSFDFKCPTCTDSQSLTSKGLYNRVRNVIDLTSHYYIGAEYL